MAFLLTPILSHRDPLLPKRHRRSYKLWEEGKAPAFVLELTSGGTWLEDAGNKRAICARLGVAEIFLFDPEADYLVPPLQGYRLIDGEYRRIEPDAESRLVSETLGLGLYLSELELRFVDLETGEVLLRSEELRRARREAETRARSAERELERLRADASSAKRELERLRTELGKR